ncbi:substrate-binding domain-containing protein [Oceanicaulis sp.]|uniref:substrate-binding domain-containing protein n=1 Tax=Oceanicaulis sp. TaxID=1924941 RepID=UPI003BAD5190
MLQRRADHLLVACAALALIACGEPREDIVLLDEPMSPAAPSDAETTVSGAGVGGRDGLRMVGSSTVFPFATAVAENFGAKTRFPTPVVEATGTGGGMNLFCAGVGLGYPDLTGASRPIKATEYQLCQDNGVVAITEIPIGYDGIVLGNSISADAMDIERVQLYLALAAQTPMPVSAEGEALFDVQGGLQAGRSYSEIAGFSCTSFIANPFQRWSDISSDLPAERIEVFGPPPTSGTRDAFVELDMIMGAKGVDCLAELSESDEHTFERLASRIREDGAWVDAGENDNTIVQTLANSPAAFGIFGYSFLEQNGDRIQAARVDGIEPTYENISNGVYPGSRSLFIYVKNQHAGVAPGLAPFVEELTSEDAWGPFGYLAERGLIALPEARRQEAARNARALRPMQTPAQ